MVIYFVKGDGKAYAVDADHRLEASEAERLTWLLGGASPLAAGSSLSSRRRNLRSHVAANIRKSRRGHLRNRRAA